MFCFQCQETAKGTGCTVKGVCGKQETTANLQDLLIYDLKGIAVLAKGLKNAGVKVDKSVGLFISQGLFTTITNANFDNASLEGWIKRSQAIKQGLKTELDGLGSASEQASIWKTLMNFLGSDDKALASDQLDGSALWFASDPAMFQEKAKTVGVLATENEDVRSLRELLILGLKGIGAYAEHAAVLGVEKEEIYDFVIEGMASTTEDHSVDEMVSLVLRAGECAVTTMAALDTANTTSYGHPEISEVNIGGSDKAAILISGHDLKDLEELMIQTQGTGIDVYTHGEMLPAHYYPTFKKYENLKGNYGSSWWHQNKDFESFNGPILMTTNCIVPIRESNSYKNRIYTTGMAGYPGVSHIADRVMGKAKDFSAIIKQAKGCSAPEEIETGTIVGGFAHNQVIALADKVVEAVKSGAIKRFVVMAGCDGRQKGRGYFTEVAEKLPKDTVILTAGCAKYRYNKLNLGDIGGIPRVLDAGQCNDSYSLAVIALKLKEVFQLEDINELPISFDIGWYEQKAVAVLLALLHLGVKGIRLGPSLPAFISPAVLKVLVDNFNIKPIGTAESDIADMMAGN
ncbi:hydroxylamine reductase [Desulfotalea psychrophila]|uniref:Hydroxylamine reductase n=1 Tax=Desulfotalea psychrophila (strain LSv54 / DSM 12343) TaxID=177439 RepID=Q6ANX0_DESPS|nr:hydroxylamine reductase [Desulfotalea psychrophila]CAG35954.1 probable hybrid cluster prismane protein [Desulfotalea psychrophila LSv54]